MPKNWKKNQKLAGTKKKKIKVRVNKETTLEKQLAEIYDSNGDLSTTCLRQCNCCRVACPQMNYSEALNIVDCIWKNCSKEKKKDILFTCIKYFFSKSLIKPCPILNNNECLVYANRPINCRLYGLWLKEDYEKRVERLSNILKLDKSQIPLNVQCQYVTRKNGNQLTSQEIEGFFNKIDELDLQILCNKDLSKKEEWQQKISKKWNYRTLHDWILFFFFGEEWLISLTTFALAANKDSIDGLVKALEEQLDTIVERGKKND